MKLGRLLLRLAVGGFFIGHGTQKLFGWFGGLGLDGTGAFFEQLGLRPGKRHALAAGLAEAGGGAMLVAGFATPMAASVITATMLTAIQRVHLSKGPWVSNGGYEYNVVLIAAVLTLVEVGPGEPSVDSALAKDWHGPRWALASLLAGAAGAAGAHVIASSQPAPPPSAEAQTPAPAETEPSAEAQAPAETEPSAEAQAPAETEPSAEAQAPAQSESPPTS